MKSHRLRISEIDSLTKTTIAEYWEKNPLKHIYRKVLNFNDFVVWLFAKKRGYRKYDKASLIIDAIINRPWGVGINVSMGRTERIYYIME